MATCADAFAHTYMHARSHMATHADAPTHIHAHMRTLIQHMHVQELRLQREAADLALSDSHRQLEVVVHTLEGELAERSAAVQRLQDKCDSLSKAVSERTAEVVAAKVRGLQYSWAVQ